MSSGSTSNSNSLGRGLAPLHDEFGHSLRLGHFEIGGGCDERVKLLGESYVLQPPWTRR
jgi:hypothetical protein